MTRRRERSKTEKREEERKTIRREKKERAIMRAMRGRADGSDLSLYMFMKKFVGISVGVGVLLAVFLVVLHIGQYLFLSFLTD